MYLFQDRGEEKPRKTAYFGCSNRMYDANGNRTGFTFFSIPLGKKNSTSLGKSDVQNVKEGVL